MKKTRIKSKVPITVMVTVKLRVQGSRTLRLSNGFLNDFSKCEEVNDAFAAC